MSKPAKKHSPAPPLTIRAYFDFMCPWSYLGRARLKRAMHRAKVKTRVEWIPFELYAHDGAHAVEKERILGHEHLMETYAQLHALAAQENLIILHPHYEGSSRRALTGFLYAQKKGNADEYMDLIYEQVFEHTANIASLLVLERVAIKLGWNPREFASFIENPHNQSLVEKASLQSRAEGVRGIPTYLVNHLPITGALPVTDLIHILHSLHHAGIPADMLAPKKIPPIKRKIPRKRAPAKKRKRRTR